MEDRINKLETMITRLTRRQVKKQQAVLTPYPISNCIQGEEVKGDIMKYMFPCAGIISKGAIYLDHKPKVGASIIITIENDRGRESKSFNINRRDLLTEPNIEVLSWDRLTISFFAVDPNQDKFSEVWLSFLWIPKIADAKIKNFLIDELDNVPEE